MHKSVAFGVAITAAAMTAWSGSGIAYADDDFSGQTYAEARDAITKAGMTSRMGSVVGDQLPVDQCVVSGSQSAEAVGSSGFSSGTEIVLDLDCNAAGAKAGTQQSEQAADDAQESKNQSLLEEQATPDQAGEGGSTGG